MNEGEMKLASLLASVRNHLTEICSDIDEYIRALAPPEVEEKPSAEAGTVSHITDKAGRTLGRIVERQDEAAILPLENLQIKASDPAVQNFLVPRILQVMKDKDGINYAVVEDRGLLKEIRLKGADVRDKLEELRSPLAWTFEKASTRGKVTLKMIPDKMGRGRPMPTRPKLTLRRHRSETGSEP